jgi:hypothetical protein
VVRGECSALEEVVNLRRRRRERKCGVIVNGPASLRATMVREDFDASSFL